VRAERVLLALAVHSQQLGDRLDRLEARLDEIGEIDPHLDAPTHDDLLEVRLHGARVSAEVSRLSVELQGRIDDLAAKLPAVIAEDQRQQRARTFAETILDLSDSLDTTTIDLRDRPGDWAATA
jgi:hypothetical protein